MKSIIVRSAVAGLAAGELLDRAVERAFVDGLQRFGQGVEADDGHVEAGGLGRLDGAEGHVVVGGDDGVHVRVGAQAVLGDGQALVAVEVAGLLADDLDVAGRVDDVVKAGRAVDGGRSAGRAEQLDDLGAVGEHAEDGLALLLAADDVVGAHMAQQAVHALDTAVDGDDRDAGVDDLLDDGCQAFSRPRADDETVIALGDDAFQVGDLLGGVVLAVEGDDLDVAHLGGLVAHLLLHVHEEGEAHRRHREGDGVGLAFGGGAAASSPPAGAAAARAGAPTPGRRGPAG